MSGFWRNAKRTALTLLAALLAVTPLAGCTTEEIGLVDALAHQPTPASYEYEGDFSISLDFDLNEEAFRVDRPDWNSYEQFPNEMFYHVVEAAAEDAGFNVSVKSVSERDDASAEDGLFTKGAAEVWITPNMYGGSAENLATGMWAEVDLDSDVTVKEYFLLPRIVRSVMWDQMKDREYITLTSKELLDAYDTYGMEDLSFLFSPEFFRKAQESALHLNDAFANTFTSLAGYLDTETAYVESVGEAEGGGTAYRVKITDDGLKELLRSIVNMDKEDMRTVAKTFTDALDRYYTELNDTITKGMDLSQSDADILDDLTAFDEFFGGENSPFDQMYPMFVTQMNDLLDAADKVELLGGDGLVIDIDISDDGFVTRFDIALDLVLDIRGESIASGERFDGKVRKVRLGVDFTNRVTNVNGDVVVEMPNVTARNSISFTELIEAFASSVPSAGSGSGGYGSGSGGSGSSGGGSAQPAPAVPAPAVPGYGGSTGGGGGGIAPFDSIDPNIVADPDAVLG